MKISRIRSFIHYVKYDANERNTLHAWTGRSYLLLALETDDGIEGLGEIYTDGMTAPEVVQFQLDNEVAPILIGMDASRIRHVREKLVSTTRLSGRAVSFEPIWAGIDIALWDIRGKQTGLPISVLAGGYSDKVLTYASGGFFGPNVSPCSLAEQATLWKESGYGGAKIKGAAGSPKQDVERISAIRDAMGPDRLVMIDTMFRPSVPNAIRLARELAPFELHFFEAPTAIENPAGWAFVRAHGRIPLAGPELVPDLGTMRSFVDHDAVDFLQLDVTLAGGITIGLEAASLAAVHHRTLTLHCAGSAVAVAASAHLGAAIHNCDSMEFHVIHRGLHDTLWDSGWSLRDGWLHIPDRPGLGLPFDFDWITDQADA